MLVGLAGLLSATLSSRVGYGNAMPYVAHDAHDGNLWCGVGLVWYTAVELGMSVRATYLVALMVLCGWFMIILCTWRF